MSPVLSLAPILRLPIVPLIATTVFFSPVRSRRRKSTLPWRRHHRRKRKRLQLGASPRSHGGSVGLMTGWEFSQRVTHRSCSTPSARSSSPTAGKQDALLHTVSSLLFFVLLEFLSEFAATHCKGYVKALCLNFVFFGGPVLGVGLYFIAVVLLVPRGSSPSRSIAALTSSAPLPGQRPCDSPSTRASLSSCRRRR